MWHLKPLLGVARWIWIAAALTLSILAVWWLVSSLTSGQIAKTQARLSTNQTEAALASGTDAVQTVSRTIEHERHTDIITRETERVIRSTQGADAPVDPDLDRIARERLCKRTAYLEHADCLLDPAAD
jgi:hypothetical protein